MECRYCKNKDICQYGGKVLKHNCPSYEYRGYGERTAEKLGLTLNEFSN